MDPAPAWGELPIGLGCWAFGGVHWGDDVRDEDSVATVHAALDAGVQVFDTAPLYGDGHADEVLVRALGDRRRAVLIATKAGARIEGGHATSDLRPANLEADVEASLRRLGLDCLPLVQLHWPCERGTPLDESLGALDRLREQGKVRHYGLCNYDSKTLQDARAKWPIMSLQAPLSLLRREAESATGPACATAGVAFFAYEPLCRGLLSGRLLRERVRYPDSDMRARDDRFHGAWLHHNLRVVADLARVAEKLGVPTAALALGWVLSRPFVTLALVGAKRPAQLQESLRARELAGRAKVWSVVDRILALHGGWPPGGVGAR